LARVLGVGREDGRFIAHTPGGKGSLRQKDLEIHQILKGHPPEPETEEERLSPHRILKKSVRPGKWLHSIIKKGNIP